MRTEQVNYCTAERVGENVVDIHVHAYLIIYDDHSNEVCRETLGDYIKSFVVPTKITDEDLARYANNAMKVIHELEMKATQEALKQLREIEAREACDNILKLNPTDHESDVQSN